MSFLKTLFWHPTSHPLVQLIRYGLVVCIAFPIDFGLLYVFTEYFHFYYLTSTILAFSISMLANFAISILWVFRTRAHRPLWKEIAAFFIIGFIGLGLTAIIVWFCTDILGIYYLISKLIAVSFVFFWSFAARRLLFTKHMRDYLDTLPFWVRKARPLIKSLRSPAAIVLFVCLGLMLLNLIMTYRLRPFNSDDVFWQAILLNWQPFDGSTVTLGNSSVYVDKIPFYQLFDYFFEPSRKVLFVQAAITALLGFVGFYLSSLYFLKKAGAQLTYFTLLPFVWLTSFGYSFIQLYLNTNWRGFQLGVSFAFFALVAAIWYRDISLKTMWSKIIVLLASAYGGLQIYSDPYFLYFTVGPIILFSLILLALRKIDLRRFAMVMIPAILSLVFSKLFAVIAAAAGIRTTIEYPMEFIHFENIADSFNGSIHSILIIFNADFFGLKLNDIATIVPLINVALLGYLVYQVGVWLAQHREAEWLQIPLHRLWFLFFIGVAGLVFASHSISTLGQGTFTYRYFLLFTLIFSLLFAFIISRLKSAVVRYCLVILLILGVVCNVSLTVIGSKDAARADVANNHANTLNYVVSDILKNKGYQKGYANYWDANISTYLSGGAVSFLPSVCNDHQAQKWHWLINDTAFEQKATKSFYFFNPDVPAACEAPDVRRQFGPPAEAIPIGNKTLLLYHYDITSRMGVARSDP